MNDVTEASLPKAIFLMGQTASGKTALAIALRKVLPVELISVDSALIYRGMDIGTAKPDAAELSAAPHRLLDILDPAEAYSAADFRRDALAAMADIVAAGRIPLLVGGTMLDFKALLKDCRLYRRLTQRSERGLSSRPQSRGGMRYISNYRRSIPWLLRVFIQMIRKGFPGHWKFFSFRVKL